MNPDPTSLDRLHEIAAPPSIPWWPPAPAWSWVLGALAVGGAILVLRLMLRWQRNRYRREALADLAASEAALGDPSRRAKSVTALAELLKRAALSAWPREKVASLTGPAWLSFLDRTARMSGFANGPGAGLERYAYEPQAANALTEPQARELTNLARAWVERHERDLGDEPC